MQQVYSGPITQRMIEVATKIALDTIQTSNFPSKSSPVSLPQVSSFIHHLARISKLNAATFLTTLVYLSRLQHRLPKTARGIPSTTHRIFIATFIIATKYLNDVPLKNKTWSNFSCLFSVTECNLMERQLLFLLDYNLKVEEWELAKFVKECHDVPMGLKMRVDTWSINNTPYTIQGAALCKKQGGRELLRILYSKPAPVYENRLV